MSVLRDPAIETVDANVQRRTSPAWTTRIVVLAASFVKAATAAA